MALYGHMNEFNPDQENIADYLDRLSFYLEANGVTEDKQKKAILLTVIGAVQFRLLKDLSAPATPKDKSYDRVNPVPERSSYSCTSKIFVPCKIRKYSRCKQPNKTITEFLQHCADYQNSAYLVRISRSDCLRDL